MAGLVNAHFSQAAEDIENYGEKGDGVCQTPPPIQLTRVQTLSVLSYSPEHVRVSHSGRTQNFELPTLDHSRMT